MRILYCNKYKSSDPGGTLCFLRHYAACFCRQILPLCLLSTNLLLPCQGGTRDKIVAVLAADHW